MSRGKVLFGYRTVTGVPPCPCRDPGTYMALERLDGLRCQLRCWCGATMGVTFDSEAELANFLMEQGVESVNVETP